MTKKSRMPDYGWNPIDDDGKNETICDTSPLLWDDLYDGEWWQAFDELEKHDDVEPLARMIETRDASHAVMLCVADLIRRKLGGKQGRSSTPLYDLPDAAKKLFSAELVYKDLQRGGHPRAKALTEAADIYRISKEALKDHIAGKLSATRRLKQERKAFVAALSHPREYCLQCGHRSEVSPPWREIED